MTHKRRWASLFVGGAGLAALLFVLVPAASSQGVPDYTAAINPSTAVAGASGNTFRVTITNLGSTSDSLGSAQITVPGGYSSVAASTSTGGWHAGVDNTGHVVTLTSDSGSELGANASVVANITADAPTTTGSATWSTAADGSNDFSGTAPFTLSGSDPSVTIVPGPLDHFDISSSSTPGTPIGDQGAGHPFTIYVTAYDANGNIKTDYPQVKDSPTVTGLADSPAPTSTPPDYPTLTFSDGVASGDVTAYFANDPANDSDLSKLTVKDGGSGEGAGISSQSTGFKVAPAGLDHFTFGPISGVTAGTPFGVTVAARDQYANREYDYNGGGTTVGGLLNSPAPINQPPVYPSLSFSAGVASGNVQAFFANDPNNATDNSQLTVSGGGKSGSSDTFKVAPAGLDHFTFATIDAQIAGKQFGITVTGRDQYANREYDFNGNGTLTGLKNSPAPSNHAPGYPSPLGFTNGVGTGDVTAYFSNNPNNANDTSQLSISGGAPSRAGSSNTFKVQAADPATLTFTTQPNDTQPNPPSCSGNAVCVIQTAVKDLDQYSNPEVGVAVNVQIDPANNPGNDTLTGLTAGECTGGVCTQNADNNGVATFSDLTLHNVAINYKLKATSGPTVSPPGAPTATQISAFFNVAQTVTKCNGNCSASAQDQGANITATASGVNGNLSVALEARKITNSTACVITNQVGDLVTVNPTGPVSGATLEVTGTLLHTNNRGGVGNVIFCKNKGTFDPTFHAVPLCSQTKPKNAAPCLKKLSGNGQGDVFFDLIALAIPDPNNPGSFIFDPSMGGGGG